MTSLSAIGMLVPSARSTVRRYEWSSSFRSPIASRYAACSSALETSPLLDELERVLRGEPQRVDDGAHGPTSVGP